MQVSGCEWEEHWCEWEGHLGVNGRGTGVCVGGALVCA